MDLIAYSVVNMYMKGIQAGIQAAHSQTALCMNAVNGVLMDEHLEQLLKWSSHPTMILKNGGGHIQMMEFMQLLIDSNILFHSFYEPGLLGALTSLTVITPDVDKVCERIYHNGCDMGRPELDILHESDQVVIQHIHRLRSAN